MTLQSRLDAIFMKCMTAGEANHGSFVGLNVDKVKSITGDEQYPKNSVGSYCLTLILLPVIIIAYC